MLFKLTRWIPATLLFLFSLSPFSSILATNGAIAFAYPLSNITIDGQLDDWPAEVTAHPINIYHYGTSADGPEDAVAHFRAGYDGALGVLYLAVTMADDDYVKTPDNNHYTSHDFQVLYLDPAHAPGGSGVIAYEVDEHHRKIVEQEGLSFYPQVAKAKWEDVDLTIKRTEGVVTYEWKVKIKEELRSGRVIGFDYAVFDKDTDQDHAMLTWGPVSNKFVSSGRIGDLVLLAKGEQAIPVKGQLNWAGPKVKEWPASVMLRSLDDPAVALSARVDSLGHYKLMAPLGKYRLELTDQLQMEKWFRLNRFEVVGKAPEVAVKTGKEVRVPPLAVRVVDRPDLIPEKGVLMKPFTQATARQVDEYVEAYREYYNIPAVSVALIQQGKMVYSQQYGVENTITEQPLRPTAVFEAASITKSVFAYVMNRLAQRGEFDLDQPLHEILTFPELEEDYPEYKQMTARHVLTHVSGLPNWGARMINKPGTKYGYSGEGFEYLKKAVAGGVNDDLPHIIQALLDKEVLGPLGMENTYFKCEPELKELKVAGHFDGVPMMYDCPNWPGMAFSMHTEAKDFVPFALALLERKGLDPAQAKEMFSFHTLEDKENWLNGKKTGFGLGIALRETPHGLAFGHGGNNGDFRCTFEVYDELETGFIIFTNADSGGPLLFDAPFFLVEGRQ